VKHLAKKIIRKYQKELELKDWSIDVELNPKVKTSIYFRIPQKVALLVINNAKIRTEKKLGIVIKYQMIKLKEEIKLKN